MLKYLIEYTNKNLNWLSLNFQKNLPRFKWDLVLPKYKFELTWLYSKIKILYVVYEQKYHKVYIKTF